MKLKGCKPKISEVADILKNESDVVRTLLSEAVKLMKTKLVQSQLLLPHLPKAPSPAWGEWRCASGLYTDTSEANATDCDKREQDVFRHSVFAESSQRLCYKDARASFNF